jgi:hypothetical protein
MTKESLGEVVSDQPTPLSGELTPRPPIVPMPPALDTAAASSPPDVRAMPASMMGYLMPSSLVSGVFRAGGAMIAVRFSFAVRPKLSKVDVYNVRAFENRHGSSCFPASNFL